MPNGYPSRLQIALGALRLGVSAWTGALRAGAPEPLDLPARLAMLATTDAPLDKPVEIRWNDRQIPFIRAETDADLPVALGIVHAHLRLAQIEMMRRVATGRLAESVGSAAIGLDHALRTIDFVAAGRQAESALSDEGRQWMEGFLKGLNHQIANTARLPHELEVLGLEVEPWRFEELMAVTRLACTDFTWRIWMGLLKLRGRPDWDEIWSRLIGDEALPDPSLAGGAAAPAPSGAGPLLTGLASFGRGGSNAYAVSGDRTASGKPLLAGDPHLTIQLPNLWLAVGLHAPSYHAVGLMVPAVPALGLGRNRHIAWGGTNLHAMSSDLVDAAHEPAESMRTRRERIKVRWSEDREIVVRDSALGPIVSDVPLLGLDGGRTIALHWMGHRPSDEVTPLLHVSKARDWQGFVDALDGYAIPGLNMIYADAEGHIGQSMAATLPRRPKDRPTDIISKAEALEQWRDLALSADLPQEIDPACGYVASANNAPLAPVDITISQFFSPDDRVKRLGEVLGASSGADGRRPGAAAARRDLAAGRASARPARAAARGDAGAGQRLRRLAARVGRRATTRSRAARWPSSSSSTTSSTACTAATPTSSTRRAGSRGRCSGATSTGSRTRSCAASSPARRARPPGPSGACGPGATRTGCASSIPSPACPSSGAATSTRTGRWRAATRR